MIFSKGAKTIQWGKDIFSTNGVRKPDLHIQKTKLEPYNIKVDQLF